MEQQEAKPKGGPWSRLTMPQAVFLLAALALALVAVLGRYETKRDVWPGAMWRLDRWTGEQVWCTIPTRGAPWCKNLPRPTIPRLKPWERDWSVQGSTKPVPVKPLEQNYSPGDGKPSAPSGRVTDPDLLRELNDEAPRAEP